VKNVYVRGEELIARLSPAPRQCGGDRAQGPHEANLFDIQAKYGDVVEQPEAIDYLRIPAEVVR
jgi:maleamate amidohydrolase